MISSIIGFETESGVSAGIVGASRVTNCKYFPEAVDAIYDALYHHNLLSETYAIDNRTTGYRLNFL